MKTREIKLDIAEDRKTFFKKLESFIFCTKKNEESNHYIVSNKKIKSSYKLATEYENEKSCLLKNEDEFFEENMLKLKNYRQKINEKELSKTCICQLIRSSSTWSLGIIKMIKFQKNIFVFYF